MCPFPDSYSATLADAAMGSTREADRQADCIAIKAALAQMQSAANALRLVEGLGWWIDTACHEAGDAVEVQIERINMVFK